MKLYTRQEVLDEAKHLAQMLAQTEEIERFKQIEAKINANDKVQRLVTKIKTLQKQAVNLEAYNKTKALKIVEEELKKAEEELELVSGTIAREVTNYVIKDTGGNVLTGKTGKHYKNETAQNS